MTNELNRIRKVAVAASTVGIALTVLIAVVLLEATLLKGLLAVSAFALTVISGYTWWVEHAQPALKQYLSEEEVDDAERSASNEGVRPALEVEDVREDGKPVNIGDKRAA